MRKLGLQRVSKRDAQFTSLAHNNHIVYAVEKSDVSKVCIERSLTPKQGEQKHEPFASLDEKTLLASGLFLPAGDHSSGAYHPDYGDVRSNITRTATEP